MEATPWGLVVAPALGVGSSFVLGVQGETRVLRTDATRLPPCDGTPFDLVFLDPPYGLGMISPTISGLVDKGWASDDALYVIEQDKKSPEPLPELSEASNATQLSSLASCLKNN